MPVHRAALYASCIVLLFAASARDMAPHAAAPSAASHYEQRWPALDEVLQVELRVSPSDWDTLRAQGRSLTSVFSGCFDASFEYTSFEAQLKVGSQDLGRVSLRKKGFIGSLSTSRPSLRVNLAAFAPDQRLFGSKSLVLNNSRQDPSFTHQCMAFAAFEAAGVPAPRCGFAHVTVNGRDLGHYVMVEPIKKPFLRRAFGADSGALYEGAGGADFRAEQLGRFEDQENAPAATELLERIAAVLASPGDDLPQRLGELIDLPAFLRFWAVEVAIAHWDGYTGDSNNFYVYVPPTTGKLVFIPWGTDGAFSDHPFLPKAGRPQSVYAAARLPRRLYALAETREQYRDALRAVLAKSWDDAAMLAQVDRIAASVGDAKPAALAIQRAFIRSRRAELLAELNAAAPVWPFAEARPIHCRAEAIRPLSAAFDVTFADLERPETSPDNRLDVELGGERHAYSDLLASAGLAEDPTHVPTVRLLAPQPDGAFVVLELYLGEHDLRAGEARLHGMETYGVLGRARTKQDFQLIGLVGDGTVSFEEVGTSVGARVRGRLQAQLVSLGPGRKAQP